MSDAQQMVTDFHRAFDSVIGTSPAIPDEATCALRLSLIQEEFDELRAALAQGEITDVAKELADLLYVVYGTAVSCGIDIAPVFQEVHRSNMSKVGGQKRADGKWLKPPDYHPAVLQPLLMAQGMPSTQDRRQSDVLPERTHRISDVPPEVTYPAPDLQDSQVTRPTPSDQASRHARLPCPRCRTPFVRRSHRQGFTEHLLSWFYLYPFRCQVCKHRFRAYQFRVRYTKRLIDRRQYERLSVHFPVTFAEAIKPGQSRTGTGTVTDLSLGGCSIHTVTQLAEGTVLGLELQTARHGPALTVEVALVRSVRPSGAGVEFLRLTDAEHERLGTLMRRLHAAQDVATAVQGNSTI